jgi:hypothetical protein
MRPSRKGKSRLLHSGDESLGTAHAHSPFQHFLSANAFSDDLVFILIENITNPLGFLCTRELRDSRASQLTLGLSCQARSHQLQDRRERQIHGQQVRSGQAMNADSFEDALPIVVNCSAPSASNLVHHSWPSAAHLATSCSTENFRCDSRRKRSSSVYALTSRGNAS